MMKNNQEIDILKKVEALSVPILETVNPEQISNFKWYHERYYESKYCVCFNADENNHDILLRFHTNRLILISIAEGHDIIRNQRVIERIDFQVDGVNMLNISISGKKKAGAKRLKKQSVLCKIKCKGVDQPYPIYTCVPSSLIEVNPLIMKNPQLLVDSYKELGYIAVLYPQCFGPNASVIDKMISKLELLCEDEYRDYLKSRGIKQELKP